VVELKDGRIMMLVRTQLGYPGKAYSEDGGDTWSTMTTLGVQGPEAPATLRRIPSTGDLLLVWNNTYTAGAGHGGERTPLTAAISRDEGETWSVVDNLESDLSRTFSYISLTFVRNRAVMSYWDQDKAGYSCRFRSLPVSWFYR
ncbi:MAG: sialidase family protein, partial [Pirellulaceae bacterium]